MDKRFKWRSLVLLLLWGPLAVFSTHYALKKLDAPRFEFLLGADGVISALQREDWLQSPMGLRPHDLIVSVNGLPFDASKVRDWIEQQPRDTRVELTIKRSGRELHLSTPLRRFSKNDLLILFWIPFFLSVVFLGFALGVAYSRRFLVEAREAVEIFSILCFSISLFFLGLMPATTLGSPSSLSYLVPLLSILMMHLFLVYPKKKGSRVLRLSFLASGYFLVFLFPVTSVLAPLFPNLLFLTGFQKFTIPFSGVCVLVAIGSLGNTLLASRDFWARRRARLLSLVVLLSFTTAMSMFWAALWETPRVSIERILAISLVFPSAFAGIFLKENVFNLERIFRRGVHQLLLLGMAVTFALLIGLGWNEWARSSGRDWMLWVAIAIAVVAIARPAGAWFENQIHRFIQTKVKYPNIHGLFENAHSLKDFLNELSMHFESHLNMKNISFAFFQDPTRAWQAGNEQIWVNEKSGLIRTYLPKVDRLYSTTMFRGEVAIGEICFDGGDALAFDPYTSSDWAQVVRDTARCIEILCLREFIAVQQSFLAVGRMQSLLAHQMKNPLAIIKVCAGLLATHTRENEEAEELIRTIQGEVGRVSAGLQSVFEHSSKAETKQKVHLGALLDQVKDAALSRFPGRAVDVSYFTNGKSDDSLPLSGFWLEKEGFRQVVSNLVVNAFEAGSSWVGIEIRMSDEEFSCVVKDRGPGIHETVDLFKPFVTTKNFGTGLGLSHVKAFVDRSAGKIRVESKRGEGATFVLDFPKQFVLNENI